MAEHTIYDWGKDYGIPFLIPLLVWWLTWLYGAGRAEKQKELNELRDNLNFLVSVSLTSLNSLIFLKERLQNISVQLKNAVSNTDDITKIPFDEICYGFVFDNIYANVDLAKYSFCIKYNKDFVSNITLVKSLFNAIDTYVKERNNIVMSIAACENENLKYQRYLGFLKSEPENIAKFLYDINRMTILLAIIIEGVQELSSKIKNLNLVISPFSAEQIEAIKEANLAAPKKKQENG